MRVVGGRLLTVVLAVVIGLVGFGAPGAHAAHTVDFGAVDDYVSERMAAASTPGLAYAIVGPEGIIHERAWGEDGAGEPVKALTPFLWGSVSKPVTATAVMSLVEEGRVELDAPVRRYLPWFTVADIEATERITVRHLLEQTSGLPQGTGVTDRFDDSPDPYRRGLERLSGVDLQAPPGERFGYTSANYMLLGAVVEAVTGRPFDHYLRAAVLEPLGMDGAVATPEQARAGLPPGHRYVAGRPVAMTSPYDPAGASYGYLGGTLRDISRFAQAHLAGGGGVLTPDSVAEMHAGTATISEYTSYGLGWRETVRDGLRMVWHSGASPGYVAAVVLLPEHDRAVVLLQNVYGFFQDGPLVATTLNAVRLFAGLEPRPIGGDALYPVVLATLGMVVLALLVGLGWSTYRVARPRQRSTRRWRIAAAATLWTLGFACLAVAAVGLPRALGADNLRVVSLFAPDLGWALMAVTVLAITLIPVRLVVAYRRLRSAGGGSVGGGSAAESPGQVESGPGRVPA